MPRPCTSTDGDLYLRLTKASPRPVTWALSKQMLQLQLSPILSTLTGYIRQNPPAGTWYRTYFRFTGGHLHSGGDSHGCATVPRATLLIAIAIEAMQCSHKGPSSTLPGPAIWSRAKASSVNCGGKAKGLPGRGEGLGLSSGVEWPLKGEAPSAGGGGTRRSSRECAKKHRDLSHCAPSLHSRVRNLQGRSKRTETGLP